MVSKKAKKLKKHHKKKIGEQKNLEQKPGKINI